MKATGPSSVDLTPSYYSRNKERLKAAQRARAFVQKIGRRKVSKAAKERARSRRLWELYGNLVPYSNPLALKNGRGPDLKTPPDFALLKKEVRADWLHSLEETKAERQDDWLGYHLENVEAKLREVLQQYSKTSFDPFDEEDERWRHCWIRSIAGLAQEIELRRQGEAAYRAAEEDGVLILEGHRVDLDVFDARYGPYGLYRRDGSIL
ncbi:hypothetical protein OF83DRAFT_1153622 [Amylostereum chailletii]|nr:hypothetical protein OF83DRAFT_1153622 [Amylostereum chailletii]